MTYYNPDEVTERVATLNALITTLEQAREDFGTGEVPVYASNGEVIRWGKDVDVSVFEGSDIGNSGVLLAPETVEVEQ